MFILKLQLYNLFYGVTFFSFMCYRMLLFSALKRYSWLWILQEVVALIVKLKFHSRLHILGKIKTIKLKQMLLIFILAGSVKYFLKVLNHSALYYLNTGILKFWKLINDEKLIKIFQKLWLTRTALIFFNMSINQTLNSFSTIQNHVKDDI